MIQIQSSYMSIQEISLANNQKKRLLKAVKDRAVLFADDNGELVVNVANYEALKKELKSWVRSDIGGIASPDLIQFSPGLPKTRSGKIMRRILRKIAANEFDTLGDTSTLADPLVVDALIIEHKKLTEIVAAV